MYPLRALQLGFEEGFVSREDVREWVEREIVRRETLPEALLELATLAHKSSAQIVDLLNALEEEIPASEEAYFQIAFLAARYAAGKVCLRDAISQLKYVANTSEGLRDDERTAMDHLDDALDLAAETMLLSLEQVRVELVEFLAGYPLRRPNF